MYRAQSKQVRNIIILKIYLFSVDLTQISKNSIQYEFVDKTSVRIKWREHRFPVQVQLRNVETNFFHNPSEANETSALFIDLARASIYQIEFDISKENYPSIRQTADQFIQTGKQLSLLLRNKSFF